LICRNEDYDRNNRRQEEYDSKKGRPTNLLVKKVRQNQGNEQQEQVV
jgi:hypothetical protein